jgi:hypothetical protein
MGSTLLLLSDSSVFLLLHVGILGAFLNYVCVEHSACGVGINASSYETPAQKFPFLQSM